MYIPANFTLKEGKAVHVFCTSWAHIWAVKAQLGASALLPPDSSCVGKSSWLDMKQAAHWYKRRQLPKITATLEIIFTLLISKNHYGSGTMLQSWGGKKRKGIASKQTMLETSTCSCEYLFAYFYGLSWFLPLLFGAFWRKVKPRQWIKLFSGDRRCHGHHGIWRTTT